MKASSSYALKRFVAGIHPQLPLDARDSRRLLAVLNETFRKQLDKQHPLPSHASPDPPGKRVKPISFAASRTPQTPSSHVSASEHLESILQNPLFIHGAHWSTFRPGVTDSSHPAVLTFRNLAASGAANLDAATSCLSSVLLGVKHSKSGEEQVACTLAGSEILAWLYSSGAFESPDFKKDSTLLRALVGCLVAEGRRDVPEAWLCPSVTLNPDKSDRIQLYVDWRKGIVSGLVHAMLAFRDELGNTLHAFSRCLTAHTSYLAQSGFLTGEQSEPLAETVDIFEPAGFRLTKLLTGSRRKILVSDISYNKWIAEVPKWTSNSQQVMALLKIHHPSSPDASDALSFLRASDARKASTWPPPLLQQHIKLCLDAAHLLVTQKNTEESTWVINYARNILPESREAAAKEQSLSTVQGAKAREANSWGILSFG